MVSSTACSLQADFPMMLHMPFIPFINQVNGG